MASVNDMSVLQEGPLLVESVLVRYYYRVPSKGPSTMAIFLTTFGAFRLATGTRSEGYPILYPYWNVLSSKYTNPTHQFITMLPFQLSFLVKDGLAEKTRRRQQWEKEREGKAMALLGGEGDVAGVGGRMRERVGQRGY
ncbi:hypothetical protein TIFTF001_014182 [Ficus carica]|uniref:Uncharacterized protein n=1 Tax=Ficus carica TaxID=3494 RepID=A0AA88D5D5_FICCA|nr:hypothetical protein TIFTF001_014182 [Ficus carica]